jgi:hypothetical protein
MELGKMYSTLSNNRYKKFGNGYAEISLTKSVRVNRYLVVRIVGCRRSLGWEFCFELLRESKLLAEALELAFIPLNVDYFYVTGVDFGVFGCPGRSHWNRNNQKEREDRLK